MPSQAAGCVGQLHRTEITSKSRSHEPLLISRARVFAHACLADTPLRHRQAAAPRSPHDRGSRDDSDGAPRADQLRREPTSDRSRVRLCACRGARFERTIRAPARRGATRASRGSATRRALMPASSSFAPRATVRSLARR